MVPPCGHGRLHVPCAQMPPLRRPPDQHRQLHTRQCRQHPRSPCFSTNWRRRQIGALGIIARKAESHRHDRHPVPVMECRLIQPQPLPQPVARPIGERPAACMHSRPRRLPRQQKPRPRPEPYDRLWFMRRRRHGKPPGTQPAPGDLRRDPSRVLCGVWPSHRLSFGAVAIRLARRHCNFRLSQPHSDDAGAPFRRNSGLERALPEINPYLRQGKGRTDTGSASDA